MGALANKEQSNFNEDGHFLGQGEEIEDEYINTNGNVNDDVNSVTNKVNHTKDHDNGMNENQSVGSQSLPPFIEDAPVEGMTLKQVRELEARQERRRKEIEEK